MNMVYVWLCEWICISSLWYLLANSFLTEVMIKTIIILWCRLTQVYMRHVHDQFVNESPYHNWQVDALHLYSWMPFLCCISFLGVFLSCLLKNLPWPLKCMEWFDMFFTCQVHCNNCNTKLTTNGMNMIYVWLCAWMCISSLWYLLANSFLTEVLIKCYIMGPDFICEACLPFIH